MDADTGETTAHFDAQRIPALSFSPDGSLLAIRRYRDSVLVVDPERGTTLTVIRAPVVGSWFLADGSLVVQESRKLRFHSARTGALEREIAAPGGEVTSRSLDGRLVLLHDGTVVDVTTGLVRLKPPAVCDLPSFTVRITDEDGVAVSHSVTDPSCTDEPLISAASFLPFQQTLGCDAFPTGLFTPELEYADPVGPSRCQYQLYPGHFHGELAWMLLRVPVPGSCRITTLGLELDLLLYDPSATQVLASATTPGGEDATYVLEQDFTAAGDYPVSFQAVDPEETTPGSILFTCE